MKRPANRIKRLFPAIATLSMLLFTVLSAYALCQGEPTTQPPPDSFEALAKSATAARDAGQTEQAISEYQRALAIRPDWPEGWWSLGVLQYNGDHYAEATASFTKLTQLAPQAGPAWNFLGLCEFETRDYANALAHLEKGHALGSGEDPEIARVSAYHLALLQIRNGDFQRASDLLSSTFDQGPLSAQVKAALGLALLRVPLLLAEVDPSHDALVQQAGEAAAFQARGEPEKADAIFRSLLKEYPDTPYLHEAYAASLQAAGMAKEAEEQRQLGAALITQKPASQAANAQRYTRAAGVAKAASSSTASLSANWDQAMSYYMSGRYADAVADLKSYVEQKPQDGTAWAVMGLSEFELKSYDNALLHLQRGQALGFGGSPESVRLANYTLGILLNRQGEFKAASGTLATAAGAGALSDRVQFALGMALLRMPLLPDQVDPSKRPLVQDAGEVAGLLQESKYDEAFAKFTALLKAYPKTPFLHYAYGVALASLSQYEEAEAQMRLEAQISPASELPYLRLASIALRQHRPADALPPAQQAVKLSASSGEAHYLLGRGYLELGDDGKAVSELEAAARLSPNSPEVHFNLAKAYSKAKQAEKAEQERAIFVRLNALAEQERSQHGNQSYEGPRDSADVSTSHNETGAPSQAH